LMHIIAAKAVSFLEAMQPEFHAYQKRIITNAKALANALTALDIRLVSGGTDTHLMLMDLTGLEVTGKALEALLGQANITVNKNTIPFETRSPFVTSGVRVGTPAVTTRGMGQAEMGEIAGLINRVIREGEAAIPQVRAQAEALCARFPLY